MKKLFNLKKKSANEIWDGDLKDEVEEKKTGKGKKMVVGLALGAAALLGGGFAVVKAMAGKDLADEFSDAEDPDDEPDEADDETSDEEE